MRPSAITEDDNSQVPLDEPGSGPGTSRDDDNIGVYSKAVGLTEKNILERSVSVVDDDKLLRNGLLYEIYAYCQKHQLKVTVCVDTFNALLPERFSRGENVDRALRTKAKVLYNAVRKVRKDGKGSRKRDEQLANILDKPYQHPGMISASQSSTLTPRKRKLKCIIENQKQELSDLKKTLGKERHEKASIVRDVYQQSLLEMESLFIEVQNLTSMLKTDTLQKDEWQKQIDGLSNQLSDRTRELYDILKQKNKESTRNLTKKIKRRDNAINEQKEELSSQTKNIGRLSAQLTSSSEHCTSLEQQLTQVTESKRKCQRRLSYYKSKQGGGVQAEMGRIEEQLEECYRKIKLLTSENRELQEMVQFLDEDCDVVTFQEGKYTDNVREVYMKLLNMGVGRRNIQDVIRVILRKLAGVEIERLPSESLTTRIFVEAKILSEIHVAKEIVEHKNNTLHYDETSKQGYKYGSIQVTTATRSYVLGLFDMDSGEAERYASFIKDIFGDLAAVLQKGSETEKQLGELVFSFINTMTDRCGTNACVDDLLVKWRDELAPMFFDNFEHLSHEARKKLTHLNRFKCHLHFLVGMADEANVALREFERLASNVTQDERRKSARIVQDSESGTARTVRTVCKAFQRQGSEEAGVMSQFAIFLDEKCQLTAFRGNRFNVLFWNGAAVYYHRDSFGRFFDHHGTPNRLLQAVKQDMDELIHVAGCRALGIVDKLITGPFWRLIEGDEEYLSLNNKIESMREKLLTWADDATPLLYNEEKLFPEIDVHEDSTYKELFRLRNTELDPLTVEAVEIMMHHFACVLGRQLHDQLPGGRFIQ